MKKILVITSAILLLAASCNKQAAVQPAQNQQDSINVQVRIAVEKVLSSGTLSNPNTQMPKGIKLISVIVMENKVTLDFSKEIASKGRGVYEDTLSLVSNAIHPIIQGTGKDAKYPELLETILIEGTPAQNSQYLK